MNDTSMLPPEYKQSLALPSSQIVVLDMEEEVDLKACSAFILFVMARWSGVCQHSFRALMRVFGELSDVAQVRLVIVDTDSSGVERFFARVGEAPQGAGETYWVRDGAIIYSKNGCTVGDTAILASWTKSLFGGV